MARCYNEALDVGDEAFLLMIIWDTPWRRDFCDMETTQRRKAGKPRPSNWQHLSAGRVKTHKIKKRLREATHGLF